jgi:WD40 repeat protein
MLLFKGRGPAITGLAFSPDGGTLAAGSSFRVDFWDVAARKCDEWEMGIRGVPPDNVRFDRSGKWLLVATGLERGLHVVEVPTGGGKRVGTFDVNCLAVSRAGEVLVGGESRISAFGITREGLSARKWAKGLNGSQLAGLDFFPDGKQFATVERKYSPGSATGDFVTRVRTRAARDGRLTQEAESDGPQVTQVRVSPDGQWVAFSSAPPGRGPG